MSVGYNSLAYHTMVFADGSLAESRPYWAYGAATGGHNGHTIAFCYCGYFHPPYNHVPTDAAIRAVGEEIARLVEWGFLAPGYHVEPHTWWTAGTQWATACCGELLIPRVPEIDAISHHPEPAPPPVIPDLRRPRDMTVGYINIGFTGPPKMAAYVLSGGYIEHEFTGDAGAFGIPQSAWDYEDRIRCGMVPLSGEEWVRALKKTGIVTE